MSSLLSEQPLQSAVDEVQQHLKPGAVVIVGGPEGAGRGHVVESIRKTHQTLELEAPPLHDADAGVHVLLQLLSFVPLNQREQVLEGRDLRESAFLATKLACVATSARALTLRLPRSWEQLLEARDENEDEPQLDRVRDVLRGIQDWSELPLVVLCGAGRAQWRRWFRSPMFVRLGAARTNFDLLESETLWQTYRSHAHAVRDACHFASVNPSPLQVRLLVALSSLDVPPVELMDTVRGSAAGSLLPLIRRLRQVLLSSRSSLNVAVARVLVARRPIPNHLLNELTEAPNQRVFFSDCIGYSTADGVRIPEVVREELRLSTPEADEGHAHQLLLAHYKSIDGVPSPRRVNSVDQMRAWLERAHHAALVRDEAEWKLLEPPWQEFYWARARWLSRACRDFVAAAAVYRSGVERFPSDDYGWHYFAWNADLAGEPTVGVEEGFREAVKLDETNLWWNSRYVTFLIRRAQFARAEAEYKEGLVRLRSDGTESSLAPSYHRWIIREWLEQGEVARARAVFDDVPEEVRTDPRMVAVFERLLDAEETESLGVSIYPAGQRLSTRWRPPPPEILPTQLDGKPLSAWYPAYVAEVDSEHIVLFLASDPSPESRIIRRETAVTDWQAWAGNLSPKSSTWVYVGRYGDHTRIVLNPATNELPRWKEDMVFEVSEYLRIWGAEAGGETCSQANSQLP